eukprot:scaffold56467_cov61-Phaeocystis_antarctica.AAC.3
MALSRQSLSRVQVMSSPCAVFPAHTSGQYFPSHASRQVRHSLRDMRGSWRKREDSSSAESASDALSSDFGHGGYLTPSDSKPQKRQCCPCSPACTWSTKVEGRQTGGQAAEARPAARANPRQRGHPAL